jgi:hypothetical protein
MLGSKTLPFTAAVIIFFPLSRHVKMYSSRNLIVLIFASMHFILPN